MYAKECPTCHEHVWIVNGELRCSCVRYAKEITGTWCGVELPSGIRAFDCRCPESELWSDSLRAPWTNYDGKRPLLWGSERAAVDLGMRGVGANGERFQFDTTPVSCSTYTDARTAKESELARQVKDMVKEWHRLLNEWWHAKGHRAKEGEGGSCFYQPIAICMSNFGWSIISDTRTVVVRSFDR